MPMKPIYVLIMCVFVTSLLSCVSDSKPGDDTRVIFEFAEATDELAKQLTKSYNDTLKARSIDRPSVRRLALLNTVNVEGEKTVFGKEIASSLQSKMFNPKLFTLLERDRISGLLEEYTFNESGMVEEISSAELGKLLGAELVIVCSYSIEVDHKWNESRYRIGARIVDLETGEIWGVGRVTYAVDGIISE
jgi:hypothetical protein